jgi:hypothetical protein
MTKDDMTAVVEAALERAFSHHVANLFGVYMSAEDPEEGLALFLAGFRKAVAALNHIDEAMREHKSA